MKTLLRTTALVSVIGLAFPASALANDAEMQTQIQSGSGAAASSDLSTPAAGAGADTSAGTTLESDVTASGPNLGGQANADLMASVERLRMLDQIADVQVVRIDSAEADILRQNASAGAQAGAEFGSDPAVTGSISGGGSASAQTGSTLPDQADAASDLESDFDAASQASGSSEAPVETDAGYDTSITADAGAGTSGRSVSSDQFQTEADTSAAAGYGTSQDGAAATDFEATADAGANLGGVDASGQGGTSTEFSSTFVEDNLSQIPEVAQALEENGVTAEDVVSIDVQESGEVTIYVRNDA